MAIAAGGGKSVRQREYEPKEKGRTMGSLKK
jgi:hypothetical protein